MRKLMTAFAVEKEKLLAAKLPLITILAFTLVPFMGGFFMFILQDPAAAERLGLISAKAQLAGSADWPSYLGLLAQAVSVGGIIVFAFVISWIFGREYADGTIKDLLALPISRGTIVGAKFAAAFTWCAILAVYVFAAGLIVGFVVQLPGFSREVLQRGFEVYAISSLSTILVSSPVAFFASLGRGYLTALGYSVLTVVIAQIAAAVGYGQYFPWSIPSLLSGLGGSEFGAVGKAGLFIVLFTAFTG
ncbi:MAG TPA: ABC transporter permease subunit, partial [Firmicutes bacterium]|nr:ABC transporter permease subunit [Bacillota bacterium]